ARPRRASRGSGRRRPCRSGPRRGGRPSGCSRGAGPRGSSSRARRRSGRAAARTSDDRANGRGARAPGRRNRASRRRVGTSGLGWGLVGGLRTGVRVSYPAMQSPQGVRQRARSPFVAAVLSLFFPGLGHAYAGAYQRALGWAALPILMIALGACVLLRAHPGDLISLVLTPWVLPGVFVLNILALLYRALATVDAYRVTVFLNAAATSGGGRLGRPKLIFNPISIAGLLAVILVMAGGHAVVARYDLIALDALGDQCVFIGDTPSNVNCDQGSASPSGSPGATESGDIGSPSPTITEPPVQGSALPNVTIPPWDG